VMLVNTASKCGFTPQYADLEKLYEHFKDSNFVIIGFPANNFGHQEPGSNTEISQFCVKNYGVTFQMMEKISVKGDSIHPLYSWLTEKALNGVQDAPVMWNFQKFLIDEHGNWAGVALSKESPLSDRIASWIRGK
jgi:glutathione peroxidase